MTIHFIGAGPGAADLITVRGAKLIGECPVCLYAGSIVSPELLQYCPADARIVDSHFLDLMADPVAALQRLYAELELDWPSGHADAVRDYLAAKPKGKHGTHAYTCADVGLDEAGVRAAFARYVEHYGITTE